MLLIIILAIIQGLTEFLPVSSSGHLVVVQSLFDEEGSIALEAMLHIGTLISLIVYFFKDLVETARDVLGGNFKLLRNIVIGSLPVALGGFLLKDLSFFTDIRTIGTVIVMLVVVALVMLFQDSRKEVKTLDSGESLSVSQSLMIGFFQLIALIPGTSRSGITMIGGVQSGLSKVEALRFSFLLGIPAIAGAGLVIVKDLIDGTDEVDLSAVQLLGSILLSAFVGYIAIDMSMKLVAKYGFKPFAYYRLALALVLLLLVVTNII